MTIVWRHWLDRRYDLSFRMDVYILQPLLLSVSPWFEHAEHTDRAPTASHRSLVAHWRIPNNHVECTQQHSYVASRQLLHSCGGM